MADITAPVFSAIASECIPALTDSVAWLKSATTDFSAEFANYRQNLIVVSTKVADEAREFDASTGYGNTDGGLNTTAVALDSRPVSENSMLDTDFASLSVSQLTNLTKAAIQAVARHTQKFVAGKILASVCENSEEVDSDNFTSESLRPLFEKVADMKIPTSTAQAVLNSKLYSGIITDPKVIQSTASDVARDALTKGVVREIAGWQMHLANSLPDNGEGLAGFILPPSALAVVSRPVNTPGATLFEVISDPDTGFTVSVKIISDPMHAKTSIVAETLLGCAVVQPDAILRLTAKSNTGDENP